MSANKNPEEFTGLKPGSLNDIVIETVQEVAVGAFLGIYLQADFLELPAWNPETFIEDVSHELTMWFLADKEMGGDYWGHSEDKWDEYQIGLFGSNLFYPNADVGTVFLTGYMDIYNGRRFFDTVDGTLMGDVGQIVPSIVYGTAFVLNTWANATIINLFIGTARTISTTVLLDIFDLEPEEVAAIVEYIMHLVCMSFYIYLSGRILNQAIAQVGAQAFATVLTQFIDINSAAIESEDPSPIYHVTTPTL